MKTGWSSAEIPDLLGRTAVVTGANSGIGWETASALAGAGARTVLACRDPDRAAVALARIRNVHPAAQLEIVQVDLADLGSVEGAAGEVRQRCPSIDILVNNAGVAWPGHTIAPCGTELQFAVNHLGHFALTLRLLEPILTAPAARVVTITSLGHRLGRIDDDLACERGYRPFRAYARSKLANLLFAFELDRRFRRAGLPASSLAAHPGGARTELIRESLVLEPGLLRRVSQFQDAAAGAAPSLRAATDPDAIGGETFGPGGLGQLRGAPKVVRTSARSRDQLLAGELWLRSERLVGVHAHL